MKTRSAMLCRPDSPQPRTLAVILPETAALCRLPREDDRTAVGIKRFIAPGCESWWGFSAHKLEGFDPMKIWLFSDLHLEYADLRQPLTIPEADICVVAGDLCRAPANGIHWLAEHIAPAMPCIYVSGNHEFYRNAIREGLEDGRSAAAQFPNVHFLENSSVIVDDVRFVGATLWTDYAIQGHRPLAMHYARELMNDHKQISAQRNPWKRFLPETASRRHNQSRRFIDAELKSDPIKTVVVTHHLPHARSIPKRFTGDLLNGAFASDLSEVIESGRPAFWLHGHTHDSCDYTVGDTRIVCNPYGYDGENQDFNPALVVEI